jgi:3-oxoadipate enol-lactonase
LEGELNMMATPFLHFSDVGPRAAPAVVLLHSLATHSGLWAPQVPVWSLHFRVISVDLPGHGSSAVSAEDLSLAGMAAGVVAVLDHLQVEKAAFVGLSLGGMVAQAVALGHASRVVALVNAHAGARTDASVREIWERRIDQFEASALASLTQTTLERWFPRAFAMQAPMTMEWVARLIQATDPHGYVAAIRAIQNLDHLDQLSGIEVPTLVIAGEADSAVPAAVAAQVAQCMPNARLHVLEGTGHIGNVQQPVQFTELVGQFLKSALFPEEEQNHKKLETLI